MATRSFRSNWLWGGLLTLLGAYLLLRNLDLAPDLGSAWGIAAAVAAVLFFVMWLENRQQWGWLIPAFNLAGVAAISGLAAAGVAGNLAGSIFLWFVALSFWAVWLLRREQWWALIPAGTLTVVGAIPLLSDAVPGEWIAGLLLGGIGLVFAFIYLLRREHWGAILPAGTLISVALMPPLAQQTEGTIAAAALFLGLGATFGILWLLRRQHNTAWAVWPAGSLLVFGLFLLVVGSFADYWPAFFLVLPGAWLLYRSFRSR